MSWKEESLKLFSHVFALVLAASLGACSTSPHPTFTTQAAPEANLARYTTYSWVNEARTGGNPVLFEQVRKALDASLAAAGYRQVAQGQGDMLLAMTLGARDRVDVTDWGPVGPYYPAYGRRYRYGWAYQYSDVQIRNITEGSLALDAFDAASKHPVWHGMASSSITSHGASEELIAAAAQGLVERLKNGRP